MDVLLVVLKWMLIIVLVLLLAFALAIQILRHFAAKLYMNLPWLRWLTLDDAKQLAPEFVCRLCLPLFHEQNELDVRVLDNIDEEDAEFVKISGFSPMTVHCYEFRRTKRGGRKPKFTWRRVSEAFRPA